MSQKIQITCDLCHTIKRETNHWWIAWIDQNIFHAATAGTVITFTDDAGQKIDGQTYDFCGEGCATLAFSAYLRSMNRGKPTLDFYSKVESPMLEATIPDEETPLPEDQALMTIKEDDIPF